MRKKQGKCLAGTDGVLMNKQHGFSLLGIFAGVIIIGFLIATVYRYQQQVSEKRQANELVRAITQLKTEIQAIRGVEDDVGYFEMLEAMGSTPDGFTPNIAARRWNTKWGDVYVGGLNPWIGWAPPGFGNGDGVIFAFPKVRNEICLPVIQALEPGFDFIMYVSNQQHIIKKHDVAYTNTAAVAACNDGAAGDTGILRLMLYK